MKSRFLSNVTPKSFFSVDSVIEKLLSVTLDRNFDFKKYINIRCKKTGQKLHTLARILNYVDTEKLRVIMDAFIVSEFSYCPLFWMFYDSSANWEINQIPLESA